MSKQITDLIVYWGDNVMANLYVWDVEVVKAWGPIWVGLTTVIATLFIQSRQNKRQNELTLEALRTTRQAQEREEIIRQLTKFYGPLRELRVQSILLYDKFALNIRQEYKKNKIQYRTLTYLVTKGTGSLTETDKDLLKQIVVIGKLSLKLIECQAGVVDKPALRKLLGQWGAHIRLLEMAANNELSGKPEIYDDIVFPRAIDGALESAILRLEARLVELSGRGTPHFIKGPTLHAKASEKSLTYYDRHANAYREKTAHVNLEHLWNERCETGVE